MTLPNAEGTEIMKWCQPHWNTLREAIKQRGLEKWVGDGKAAMAQMVREIENVTENPDAHGFDPLLRAWSMINSRILETTHNLFDCPLCQVQQHDDQCTNPECGAKVDLVISGCTDSLLEYAQSLGMVPAVSA